MGLLSTLGLPKAQASSPRRGVGSARPAPPTAARPPAKGGDIGTPVATRTQAQLTELARWPAQGHKAWKKLTTLDRIGLITAMEKMYGKPFAKAFEQFTKGGTKLEQHHYVTALAYQTPQWFDGKGYKLAQRSTYQQWWVHPNGHLIFLVLESTPEELKRAIDRLLKSIAKADADYGVISAIGMSLDYMTPLDIVRPADPVAAFNDYVAKLDLLQKFLDGEMKWAAQARAALVKKGIGTTEFDELVGQLAITKGSVDAMVRNQDDLDPLQDHGDDAPIDPKDMPPPIDFSGGGP